jgi:CBS domain-containing protein
VCAVSFLLSDEQSIYSSQVEGHSLSPAHQGDYVRAVLAGMFVNRFLTPEQEVPSLRPQDRLNVVIERLSASSYQVLPVVNDQGSYLGVVSLEEVHLASQSPNLMPLVVAADLMRTDVVPLHPEDRLDRALELFVDSDLLALPVVGATPEGRVLGIVKRADLTGTYLRFVQGTSNEGSK